MIKNKQRVIDTINKDVHWIDIFLKKVEESSGKDANASEYWCEAYRQQLAVYQSKIDLLEVMGYNVVCDDLSYRVIDITQNRKK